MAYGIFEVVRNFDGCGSLVSIELARVRAVLRQRFPSGGNTIRLELVRRTMAYTLALPSNVP